MQPRSDLITADSYGFTYRTYAVEHNTRYPNSRRTISWHLLGFRFELVRQIVVDRFLERD